MRGVKDHDDLLQYFEYAVVSTVDQLGPMAYPAEITRNLTKLLQRHVSLAQVFVALERLEDKGFLSSEEFLPAPARSGRPRRIFKMEASGARALQTTTATFDRIRVSPSVGKLEKEYARKRRPVPA